MNGVGVCNYLVVIDQTHRDQGFRSRNWILKDAPEGSQYPWCTSPETPNGGYPAPHTTAVWFLEWSEEPVVLLFSWKRAGRGRTSVEALTLTLSQRETGRRRSLDCRGMGGRTDKFA